MLRSTSHPSLVVLVLGLALVIAAIPASAAKDRTPPVIWLLQVGPRVFNPSVSPGFLAIVADNVGVATVTVSIMGPSPAVDLVATVPLTRVNGTAQNGTWVGDFSFSSSAAEGSYDVAAVARDIAGNSASASGDSILLDATPPVILGAGNPSLVGPGTTFYITATVSDNFGVCCVQAAFVGPIPASTIIGSVSLYEYYGSPRLGNWTNPFQFPGPDSAPEGTYEIVTTAWDDALNTVTQASGKIVLDRTPPESQILSAMDGRGRHVTDGGRTPSSTIMFTFVGADAWGIQAFVCQLDGGYLSWCYSPITYTQLSSGTHVFQVYALDNAGNADPSPATFSWKVRS